MGCGCKHAAAASGRFRRDPEAFKREVAAGEKLGHVFARIAPGQVRCKACRRTIFVVNGRIMGDALSRACPAATSTRPKVASTLARPRRRSTGSLAAISAATMPPPSSTSTNDTLVEGPRSYPKSAAHTMVSRGIKPHLRQPQNQRKIALPSKNAAEIFRVHVTAMGYGARVEGRMVTTDAPDNVVEGAREWAENYGTADSSRPRDVGRDRATPDDLERAQEMEFRAQRLHNAAWEVSKAIGGVPSAYQYAAVYSQGGDAYAAAARAYRESADLWWKLGRRHDAKRLRREAAGVQRIAESMARTEEKLAAAGRDWGARRARKPAGAAFHRAMNVVEMERMLRRAGVPDPKMHARRYVRQGVTPDALAAHLRGRRDELAPESTVRVKRASRNRKSSSEAPLAESAARARALHMYAMTGTRNPSDFALARAFDEAARAFASAAALHERAGRQDQARLLTAMGRQDALSARHFKKQLAVRDPGERWRRRRTGRDLGTLEKSAMKNLRRDPASSPPPPPSGIRLRQVAPILEPGYALSRGIRQSDRAWEDVIVDASLAQHMRFVDFRRIDDVLHAVWHVGDVLYAQVASGPRHPSRFRR